MYVCSRRGQRNHWCGTGVGGRKQARNKVTCGLLLIMSSRSPLQVDFLWKYVGLRFHFKLTDSPLMSRVMNQNLVDAMPDNPLTGLKPPGPLVLNSNITTMYDTGLILSISLPLD